MRKSWSSCSQLLWHGESQKSVLSLEQELFYFFILPMLIQPWAPPNPLDGGVLCVMAWVQYSCRKPATLASFPVRCLTFVACKYGKARRAWYISSISRKPDWVRGFALFLLYGMSADSAQHLLNIVQPLVPHRDHSVTNPCLMWNKHSIT